MEYLKFYELGREPFQNDPDSLFYFESRTHEKARLRLLRGIHQQKGLSVLIGGPGCGKTTLAHHLCESLSEGDWEVRSLVIPHSASVTSSWLLPNVAREFGVPSPSTEPVESKEQISTALARIALRGGKPVLLIDEAQLLDDAAVLQEFRGLLNLVHEGQRLMSVVLFGLPSLDLVLRQEIWLAQRVDIRVELAAMDAAESEAYLRHRLECAGGVKELFSEEALRALHAYAQGVPRVLNTLADNALFEGSLEEVTLIEEEIVVAAADSLALEVDGGRSSPAPLPSAPAAVPLDDAANDDLDAALADVFDEGAELDDGISQAIDAELPAPSLRADGTGMPAGHAEAGEADATFNMVVELGKSSAGDVERHESAAPLDPVEDESDILLCDAPMEPEDDTELAEDEVLLELEFDEAPDLEGTPEETLDVTPADEVLSDSDELTMAQAEPLVLEDVVDGPSNDAGGMSVQDPAPEPDADEEIDALFDDIHLKD